MLRHDFWLLREWAHLFSQGPPQLRLRGYYSWQWLFEEEEHVVSEWQLERLGAYKRLVVERDELVQALRTLAQFGQQAATGDYFVLHIGI